MNLKTGIMMLLVGMAIIGFVASSASANDSKSRVKSEAKESYEICGPVGCIQYGWIMEKTYLLDERGTVCSWESYCQYARSYGGSMPCFSSRVHWWGGFCNTEI
jgi:hypothetical protein